MAERMSPPGMAVVISAKPPDGPGKRMQPPGMDEKPMGDGKASPEEAMVYRADRKCIDCDNYDATSGDCSEVSGSFDPQDGCLKYFEPIGDEPDEDDKGGASDEDADDMEMPKQ